MFYSLRDTEARVIFSNSYDVNPRPKIIIVDQTDDDLSI